MDQPYQFAPTPRPRRRLGLVVAFAIGLLVIPAIALANHQFNDVPTGASYHDDVERLVGAGITTGCGGGNYCPGQAVTRGQMAQFLNRGLGIATSAFGTIFASEAQKFPVTTISIPAGNLSGGTGYVNVSADLVALVPETEACPCGVQFIIFDTNNAASSPTAMYVVPGDSLNGMRANTGTVSWVFAVPTGEEAQFVLLAMFATQPPVVLGEPGTQGLPTETIFHGSMTAEYSPFGFEQPAPSALFEQPGDTIEGPFGPMTLPDPSR